MTTRRLGTLLLAGVILGSLCPHVAWAGSKPKAVRAQRVSKAQTQAEPLIADAAAALAAHDFAKAEHLLDSAYQKWQSPHILFQLGRVAAAQNQLLAAQDLFRRYQSDPAAILDEPTVAEIKQVLEQRRPPSGKLMVLGDGGALLRLDGRLLGSLPLTQPVLIPPDKHQLTIEFPGQKLTTLLQVYPGRLAELRATQGSKAVLISLLPALIVASDHSTVDASLQRAIDGAIEQAVQGEKKSVLTREQALERAPQLTKCLGELACQEQLSTKNEADGVLTINVHAQPQTLPQTFLTTLTLVDSITGDVAATRQFERTAAALPEQLHAAVSALIQEAAARPRGVLQVHSEPSGAAIYNGPRLLGQTPYEHAAWTGRYQLRLHKPGYDSVNQRIDVSENRSTDLVITLAAEQPEPDPAPLRILPTVTMKTERVFAPRENWRLVLAGAGLGVGGLLIGLGINALQVNGKCIQEVGFNAITYPDGRCPTVYNTSGVGGSLLGLGITLVVGGGIIAALPGRPRKVDTYTFQLEPAKTADSSH